MTGPRLGFVTQTHPDWHWEAAIPAAADLGVDYVELLLDGRMHHATLADEADAVRALADDHGVDLAVHLPFRLDVASPYDHVREGSVRELAAAVETAGAVGADRAVMHATSFAWEAVWDRETVQANLFEAVRELRAVGRDHGVELCVENLKNGWLTLAEFPRLLDATDAAVALDTGHARKEGHDADEVAAFAAEHADRVPHVHVNDTIGGQEHVPVGSGDLDFAAVLGALLDARSAPAETTLSVEAFTFNYDYLAASLDHLEGVLADLGF